MKKNDEIILDIYDLTSEGFGVARYEDMVIFVNRALPGDLVKAGVTKIKKNYAYARIIEIIKSSEYRVEPPLNIHEKCGGCVIQQLDYSMQLKIKEKLVKNSLEKIGKLEKVDVLPILGMDEPFHYRNKVQYPLTYVDGKIKYGFYLPHSHKVYPNDSCLIQDKDIDKLMQFTTNLLNENSVSLYDENSRTGYLRHVVIRKSKYSGELMLAFVINSKNVFKLKKVVNGLQEYPNLVSILANFNTKNTNVILGDEVKLLHGKETITDSIGDKIYNISLKSFFQVNNEQAKVLYDKVVEFGSFDKNDSVIDLYCGIGSIGIYLADKVKKVLGVEVVDSAIDNAYQNIKLNGITNTEFICGDATTVFSNIKNKKYNCVIVDPPRRGLTQELIYDIINFAPTKIIYVSCNPTTLARDLKTFYDEGYEVLKVQPVDLFPMTLGVETVALLSKLDTQKHIDLELTMDELDLTASENKATY